MAVKQLFLIDKRQGKNNFVTQNGSDECNQHQIENGNSQPGLNFQFHNSIAKVPFKIKMRTEHCHKRSKG